MRNLLPAVLKDASSGTFKEIDTLGLLLPEDSLEVEDRRAAESDIFHDLVTGTKDIPDMLELIQDQSTGQVTHIAQKLEDELQSRRRVNVGNKHRLFNN